MWILRIPEDEGHYSLFVGHGDKYHTLCTKSMHVHTVHTLTGLGQVGWEHILGMACLLLFKLYVHAYKHTYIQMAQK